MVAKKLIAFVAFVTLITLLEQIKSGVHAGRMTKPKKAGRVKVIHTGPRVRKLKKKVEELEKQLASMNRVNVRNILLHCIILFNQVNWKQIKLVWLFILPLRTYTGIKGDIR